MAHPQMTQQFLSSVLSQRGPSSLPYSEDVKWLIRQHLLSLLESFPSLQPKTSTFTHNDGRSINLLQADGTVPMIFQNVTYNIPVIIWLIESYPRHPPCVYVNPTRDMMVKRHHPCVNPSGLVSLPYLLNWVFPGSNLVDLCRDLSLAFGRDPPLYSQRRPNQNPSPNPNPGVNFGLNPGGNLGSLYGSGAGQKTEDSNEVYRRNAINRIVERAHGDIVGLRKTKEAEVEGLFNAQAVLRQREEHLLKGVREMVYEKECLEQQLQMVLMNGDVSEAWARENDSKVCNLGCLDADDVIQPCDVLSKQVLDCTALDLAIEDVIYSLDKAVQEGSIPFDQYLRNVRLLSREQFLHRATSTKVRAVQMHAQAANMAARVSH